MGFLMKILATIFKLLPFESIHRIYRGHWCEMQQARVMYTYFKRNEIRATAPHAQFQLDLLIKTNKITWNNKKPFQGRIFDPRMNKLCECSYFCRATPVSYLEVIEKPLFWWTQCNTTNIDHISKIFLMVESKYGCFFFLRDEFCISVMYLRVLRSTYCSLRF